MDQNILGGKHAVEQQVANKLVSYGFIHQDQAKAARSPLPTPTIAIC